MPAAINSTWSQEHRPDDAKYRMGKDADPMKNEKGWKKRTQNRQTPPAKKVSPEDFRRTMTDAVANGNFQGQPVDNFFFQSASCTHWNPSPLNDRRIGGLPSYPLIWCYPPKIARTMKAPSIRAQHICDPSFSFWVFLSVMRIRIISSFHSFS